MVPFITLRAIRFLNMEQGEERESNGGQPPKLSRYQLSFFFNRCIPAYNPPDIVAVGLA